MLNLQRATAFAAGLFVQFNILVGGQTEGAASAGGYGYRASDFICVLMAGLLITQAYNANRILSVYGYAIGITLLFAPVVLLGNDYTVTMGLRYIMYGVSGLYLATIVSDQRVMDWLCYGMIAGLLGAIGVFLLQNAEIPKSTLLAWGLIAGYANDYGGYIRDTPRYSGLWGHPNEAGHVGALSAAAGIYLYITQRRISAILVTGGALLAFFYFTLSRGGLIASFAPIGIALLIPRNGRLTDPKFLLTIAAAAIVLLAASQLSFLSDRFGGDANAEGNLQERLGTMLAGLQIAITNPLGLSVTDFQSTLQSLTGGVSSPHNGFIFIAAVLGIAPLAVLIWGMANSFVVREPTDIFYAWLAFQVCLSCLFEQIPGSIPYIFAFTLLLGHAFLRTQFGSVLRHHALTPSDRLA